MLESNAILVPTLIGFAIVFAGFAVKTRTWWWIPAALVLAAGGLLTIDALTTPAQPYRAIVMLVEVCRSVGVVVVGIAVLHGTAALRERVVRPEADEPAELPRAIVLR